jgi:HAD superfamily hydrolase (TIGR01509 family)
MNSMIDMRGALVFDYDGVIADTEPLHWKSWAALLAPYGIQFEWEEYCALGLGVDDARIIKALEHKAPLPDGTEFTRRNFERKRMVREWSLLETPIPRETIELLKTLAGRPVGLVTSSERSEVEPVLRAAQIHDRFDAMVFGEDVTAHKPSPEPYLLVAQKLGVAAGIAFEDSSPGLESARAAGFAAVKVEHPRELAQLVARFLAGERGP